METQSNKSALLNAGAVVAAGVIIAGAILWSNGHPGARTVSGSPGQPSARAVDIKQVKTAGNPSFGDPNAPITIAYWFDYQCPFCQRHEEQTMPEIIKNYVTTGKARIVFKDYQFLGPDSQMLGQTSRAVWESAPDQFYAWHKAVYDNQGAENTGWATPEKIRSITLGVLGAEKTDAVLALVKAKSADYQKAMDADKAEGAALGVNGTPGTIIGTQLIDGAQPYSVFAQALDLALQSK